MRLTATGLLALGSLLAGACAGAPVRPDPAGTHAETSHGGADARHGGADARHGGADARHGGADARHGSADARGAADRAGDTSAGAEARRTAATLIPRLAHTPLGTTREALRPSPAALAVDAVTESDYRNTAPVFMHIAEASKAMYRLEPGSALAADVADAYLGPAVPWPEQTRPWAVLVEAGAGRHMLLDRLPRGRVEDLMIEAELAIRDGVYQEALKRYEQVTGLDPSLAKGWTHQAEAALALGRDDDAQAALTRAGTLSPVDPLVPTVEAALALKLGNRTRARDALARALALDPRFPPALSLSPAITGGEVSAPVFRPPVRIEPQTDEEILIQADASGTPAWLAWGICQATTRYEPDRKLLPFDEEAYGVFLRRELVCAFALADAATDPRVERQTDAAVLRIARIARAGYLGEFTLLEVVAPRFPALLLHLTPEQRGRLATYVDRFVLPPVTALAAE